MEFLLNYAETLAILILIIIISLMLWIHLPSPWKYYWWTLGFLSPVIVSLLFHLYFNNPSNYPVGLCLQAEVSKGSLNEVTDNLTMVSLQKTFLELKKNKTKQEKEKLEILNDEFAVLESNKRYLEKSESKEKVQHEKDHKRYKQLMIIKSGNKKNRYIEWDEEFKKIVLKRNFRYQKNPNEKHKAIDCPKDLVSAAQEYLKKKEPQ